MDIRTAWNVSITRVHLSVYNDSSAHDGVRLEPEFARRREVRRTEAVLPLSTDHVPVAVVDGLRVSEPSQRSAHVAAAVDGATVRDLERVAVPERHRVAHVQP